MPKLFETPSEIEKAIELFIALKSTRPKAFIDAMDRIDAASGQESLDDHAHASAVVLGIIKGTFGRENSKMLLELAPKLPRTSHGALALMPKTGAAPVSLASKIIRLHGLGNPWTKFFLQSIRDGAMPMDTDCAFDIVCRLEESIEDIDEISNWLGTPDTFHESLACFFSWPIDWTEFLSITRFDAIPWIMQSWLHEGSGACYASALSACRNLIAQKACQGLGNMSWIEFSRPPDYEHYEASLKAMTDCLELCIDEITNMGQDPCSMFCKNAHPTVYMPLALRTLCEMHPERASFVDQDGLSALYWINARISHHESEHWQNPLLECFHELISHGADPRMIAPQVPLSSMAKHPQIAALVEAAEISAAAKNGGQHSEKKTL